jgi:hypothetical protein
MKMSKKIRGRREPESPTNSRKEMITEFIMTYGWAILIVLAMIGVLAYFGAFDSDNLMPRPTCKSICESVGKTCAFENNKGYFCYASKDLNATIFYPKEKT